MTKLWSMYNLLGENEKKRRKGRIRETRQSRGKEKNHGERCVMIKIYEERNVGSSRREAMAYLGRREDCAKVKEEEKEKRRRKRKKIGTDRG